jgi:hypothetical protein
MVPARAPPRLPPQPLLDALGPPLPGGSAGRLMQLGAGGEVRTPPVSELCPLVSTPTTRMSPGGMPCAFTVMDPLGEIIVCVLIR